MDQITFYETEDGKVRIEVRFEHENLWLSQKLMAELFECSSDNISLHLKNIFKSGELDKNSVTEEYSATASDGKKYKTIFYSLEAVITVNPVKHGYVTDVNYFFPPTTNKITGFPLSQHSLSFWGR